MFDTAEYLVKKMADYIGSLNGRLNGEKTLEKKNEIYVKKLEVAICDLQTSKTFKVAICDLEKKILLTPTKCIQVIKGETSPSCTLKSTLKCTSK